ncbi:hypothetical protein GSH19_00210 [Lactobacillus sp. S2-2]|uniref:hypothetical protein n=1 Tax=Lactobacillus sp. S2-2 TaxID=2692917 RepID=UPI001F2716DB|nr:hypothetical protein [Lactobacillus sp. S2-2]MCF6514609.1 hypothetical protein [Lactobacillus sp. S2-2]
MIKKIQLKQVIRNKRFIFFTLLIPAFWYILMFNLNSIWQKNDTLYLLTLSTCIGIIGNSLITFGKRVSNKKNYYEIHFKISNYSVFNYLKDSMTIQIILNTLIIVLLILLATIMQPLSINLKFFTIFILLEIIGLYLSLIGFTIGLLMKSSVLDALNFPMMIFAMFLVIPFHLFTKNIIIFEIINKMQQIFPTYYLINLSANHNYLQNLSYFFISLILTTIPILWILAKKLKKQSN